MSNVRVKKRRLRITSSLIVTLTRSLSVFLYALL